MMGTMDTVHLKPYVHLVVLYVCIVGGHLKFLFQPVYYLVVNTRIPFIVGWETRGPCGGSFGN